MSGFLLGDVPFKKIYLHGIVRDKQGRKFSKSLNNGIDPLEMTEKYGTDALRMALVFGAAPGNDVIFDEQKVKGMKHFANKLWNIARYTLANTTTTQLTSEPEAKTDADKIILEKLQKTTAEATKYIEEFRLHEAAQSLYQFMWSDLADIYIEASKSQLQDEALEENTKQVLLLNVHTILKLLHPFMPFVTEEIWSKLEQEKLLIVTPWPK
jgi:valyl-tRNA synthetase